MPSVRVKRGDYSTLEESVPAVPTTPRSLNAIFRPVDSTADRPASQAEPTVSPTLSPEVPPRNTTGSAIRSRPRAASRVTNHVNNLRTSEPKPEEPPRSSFTSERSQRSPRLVAPFVTHDGMTTIEGPQADVVVQSDGAPGLVGSALSVDSHGLQVEDDGHHHDDIVEHLDVIDAQVATVSTLTNTANAILIPPLSFYSRKPIVVLSKTVRQPESTDDAEKGGKNRIHEDELDRHVEDVLNRPSKFKRTLHGVWSFLKTPLGVIAGIYGFLVVFWGAAIVIFLAKIINLHNPNTQGFWIEVSSQVENGLFTVTGLGLLPSRILDTWRIYRIWRYKRLTEKLRAKAGLPQLYDVDDLPDPLYDPNYVHVLDEKEQKDLHKQQVKFQNSQTWYRAHGTETHRAFPINTALLICLFNDGNSFFQIFLCGTMWGLNRFERPAWSTGILIPCSFLCGIMSGVFIWRGGKKTKRTERVEERLRAALADEQSEFEQDASDHLKQIPEGNEKGPTTQASSTATEHPQGIDDMAPAQSSQENIMGPSLKRER